MPQPVRYAWHADSYDLRLASVRCRLTAPLEALVARGVAIARHDHASTVSDAVIFCKSQGAAALDIARRTRASGRAVVYDLCDNLFAAHRAGHVSSARLARHRAFLSTATHVTFATIALAEQIAAEMPELTDRRYVVPDVLDTGSGQLQARPTMPERWELVRLDRFLRRHTGALHCIWFGKSLGRLSGYAHLDAAVERLVAYPGPVTLTVLSNARLRLWRAARRWPVPVHYAPWRLATASSALARHRVALVPVDVNDYTAGKTINRPATAILAGLGVIADAIPSYEELRPYVTLDDWDAGLAAYAAWTPATQARLAEARTMLSARYGAEAVATRWEKLLSSIRVGT